MTLMTYPLKRRRKKKIEREAVVVCFLFIKGNSSTSNVIFVLEMDRRILFTEVSVLPFNICKKKTLHLKCLKHFHFFSHKEKKTNQ